MRRHPVIALILAAIGLAGCSGAPKTAEIPTPQAPKSIQVSRTDERDRVTIDPRTGQPSSPERARVTALVATFAQPAATYVTVLGPQKRTKLEPLARLLATAGIARDHIVLRPGEVLPGAAGKAGDVELHFEHYTVAVPHCPDWSRTYGLGDDNGVSSNLGCADANNFAAMLADPRDVTVGRGSTSTDAETAARAIARYRADEVKLPSAGSAAPTPIVIGGGPMAGAAQ